MLLTQAHERGIRHGSTRRDGPPERRRLTMPKPYAVTRTVEIGAPPQVVLALLTDFRQWRRWSPWEDLDPAMERAYTGSARGVGAAYAWEGDKKAGKGTMTITGITDDRVDVALHFDKPFPADNRIVFTLAPTGPERTRVTWGMYGELNLLMRLVALVKSMDSLVGPDFEKGLARLTAVAEA
ncbi:MAG: SRPBCC family protein [Dermatophilaceae bacterium]